MTVVFDYAAWTRSCDLEMRCLDALLPLLQQEQTCLLSLNALLLLKIQEQKSELLNQIEASFLFRKSLLEAQNIQDVHALKALLSANLSAEQSFIRMQDTLVMIQAYNQVNEKMAQDQVAFTNEAIEVLLSSAKKLGAYGPDGNMQGVHSARRNLGSA